MLKTKKGPIMIDLQTSHGSFHLLEARALLTSYN